MNEKCLNWGCKVATVVSLLMLIGLTFCFGVQAVKSDQCA